ncbi:MAG: hypothetical protein JRH11_14680 [Deltaproteobacteria bacterium]|nr:hypothetical protein [Deltaproteobacteria bacterium]
MRREPLGWGLGIACGAALAIFLGPYLPSWGVALAPAVATAVFAVGAYQVPDDETLAWVLRLTVALTLGFAAATVPVTLTRIHSSPEAVEEALDVLLVPDLEALQTRLTIMWTVMVSMTPIGAIALAMRPRRMRKTS